MTKRALWDENTRLRTELQACQSRSRLAIQAIDIAQSRFLKLAREVTIAHAATIMGSLESVRLILEGEVLHV